MIRQQPEGHDTFASGVSCFCVAKVAPVALSTITVSVNWLSDKRYWCVRINHQIGTLSRTEQKSLCQWVLEIQPAVMATFALSDLMALPEGLSLRTDTACR